MSKEFIEVRGEGGWLRFIAIDTIHQIEVLWPDKARVFDGYGHFEAQIEDATRILGHNPLTEDREAKDRELDALGVPR